jgi:hypothetical protein
MICEGQIRQVIAAKEVNEPEIEGMISKEHIKVLSLSHTLIPCSVPAGHMQRVRNLAIFHSTHANFAVTMTELTYFPVEDEASKTWSSTTTIT